MLMGHAWIEEDSRHFRCSLLTSIVRHPSVRLMTVAVREQDCIAFSLISPYQTGTLSFTTMETAAPHLT